MHLPMPNETCLYNEWHLNNGIKYYISKQNMTLQAITKQNNAKTKHCINVIPYSDTLDEQY